MMETRKKIIGISLLAVGVAILVFSYVYFMTRPDVVFSPVPYIDPPKVVPLK